MKISTFATTITAYISMGANLGDCVGQLHKAIDALNNTEGITVEALSPIYWTEPQGVTQSCGSLPLPPCEHKDMQGMPLTPKISGEGMSAMPWFANRAVRLVCSKTWTSASLMTHLLYIESTLGRQREPGDVRNAPRTIDLDLLLFGEEKNASAHCTLPHPRMAQRAFMLIPLRDVLSEDILYKNILELEGQECNVAQCLDALHYRVDNDKIYQTS